MRIAISGAQNQGKSTLCNDILAQWPVYKKSDESYRQKVKELNLPLNKQATKESQRHILLALCEDSKKVRKGDKVVFDRCPLDNIVYSLWSQSKQNSDIDDEFISECIPLVREAMRNFDLIFFTPITSVAPVPLEVREGREIDKEFVEEIDNIFKAIYKQQRKGVCPFFIKDDMPPMIEIFGAPRERIELVKYYIDAEGDLIDDTNSILSPENIDMMEKLMIDQHEAKKDEDATEKKNSVIIKDISKFKNLPRQ